MLDADDTRGLRDRMDRAVGGLHAPDVMTQVMADGRHHRTQRRIKYAAGGVAAVAAAGAIGYPLAQGSPREPDPARTPGFATDPTTSEQVTPSTPTTDANGCPVRPDGWWNMPADRVRTTLAGLLPDGVAIGTTEEAGLGGWSGNLLASGPAADRDFAMVSLLPPPRERTQPQENDGLITLCGTWEPLQKVRPCAPGEACEEIRDDAGTLVGVVREQVESTIENGADVPTDKSYVLATLVGPGGGHVDIYVAEGTRDDRPDTVHDPADRPALTLEQVAELLTNPVWTSYDG